MSDLASVIERARKGDDDAFETLIIRFQDMAVGYAYALLHNLEAAEDAAQEAFFEAFRTLPTLREPDAFPGWFRRIVFKHCDRITRVGRVSTVPIELAGEIPSGVPDQLHRLEQLEMKDRVWRAVEALPVHQRETLLLFYIAGYSTKEVGDFLDIAASTVKKRLHSARNRLRELLVDEIEDSLRARRPSRDEKFAHQILDLIKAARAGDTGRVKRLLEQDPRLLVARDPLGNTALVVAVNSGHRELAEMLLDAGVDPDFFEAAAIGRTDLVRQFLSTRPHLLNKFSSQGFTALALAAHFGHSETATVLIEAGAEINVVSRHALQVTPLHAALFGGTFLSASLDAARLLIENGADVNSRRGGRGVPRSGWTPLHYCAGFGFSDLIDALIARGANINSRDDQGKTPLGVAIDAGQTRVVEKLRRLGAED
jgi:RNA polymerase sigma factor (sigma-70 family)